MAKLGLSFFWFSLLFEKIVGKTSAGKRPAGKRPGEEKT